MSDPLTDDWLDDQLLADDPPSTRNWRRRALNGMPVSDALMGIPKNGTALLEVPMDSWRLMKAHCQARNLSLAAFLREAVGMRMLAEGVPREMLDDFLGR